MDLQKLDCSCERMTSACFMLAISGIHFYCAFAKEA